MSSGGSGGMKKYDTILEAIDRKVEGPCWEQACQGPSTEQCHLGRRWRYRIKNCTNTIDICKRHIGLFREWYRLMKKWSIITDTIDTFQLYAYKNLIIILIKKVLHFKY